MMPVIKDFVSVKNDDRTRSHIHKRLLICNINELYVQFTSRHYHYLESSNSCHLEECKNCPGTGNLKDNKAKAFDEHSINEVRFKI